MGMADTRGLVTVSPVGSYKAEALPCASLAVKGCGAIHLTSHIMGFLAQPQLQSALCSCCNGPRGWWMGSSTYCCSSTLYGGCIRQTQAKCNSRLCRRLYVVGPQHECGILCMWSRTTQTVVLWRSSASLVPQDLPNSCGLRVNSRDRDSPRMLTKGHEDLLWTSR